MTLPKTLGRALAVSGSGSGLTARTLAQKLGEETHTQVLAEIAAHDHTLPTSSGAGVQNAYQANRTASGTINSGSSGSGTPFNVMQPTVFLNAMVKL